MAGTTTFSKVDFSKIDFSEYDDVTDPGGAAPSGNEAMHEMMPGMDDEMGMDGMSAEEQWHVTHLEEADVGKTFDVFPQVHGDGAVTKKLLAAGKQFDNVRSGWAAELSYTACVVGAHDPPFEARNKEIVTLVAGAFPPGVEAGIQTMREGEHALITVQPAKAFGAAGDAGKGVPPDSAVQYDITCHRIIEVTRLDEGRIVKRRMVCLRCASNRPPDPPRAMRASASHRGLARASQVRGESWEKPSENDEVTARWKGWLKDDPSTVFREEGSFEWTAGDPAVPPVFNRVRAERVAIASHDVVLGRL